MKLCLTIDDMAACTRLILVIVRRKGKSEENFQKLYRPLMPKLHNLLKEHSLDICSRPFSDLARILIGMYLSTVLGAKPRDSKLKIRDIGCGCKDCTGLDYFMKQQNAEMQVTYGSARRAHLQHQAVRAMDLVTFQTERAHSLVITKRPELVNWIRWQTRIANAKNFLSAIGNDRVIAKLMGPRYVDVENALNGTQIYTFKSTASSAGRLSSTSTAPNEPPDDSSPNERPTNAQPAIPSSSTDTMTLKRKRVDEATTTTDPAPTQRTPGPTPPSSAAHNLTSPPPNPLGAATVATTPKSQRPVPDSTLAKRVPSTPATATQVHREVVTRHSYPQSPRRSPRKSGLAQRGDENRVQKSATQRGKALGSSSPARPTAKVKETPSSPMEVWVKAEPGDESSSSTRRKRRKSYNFLGPVIDLTENE